MTACYLLDGHHKTKAYISLEMDIPRVNILKTELVKGQTQAILHASAPILKDFEFDHFLVNNDDNLENVDFISDPFLTLKLDSILKSRKRLGIGIIKLLLKLDKAKDKQSSKWLQKRLTVLSTNQFIGKGLILRYFGFNERFNENCWNYDEINNIYDFNNWIKKTLPDTRYES